MSLLRCVFLAFRDSNRCVFQLGGYALLFARAFILPRAELSARLLAAESQLSVLHHNIQQKKVSRPKVNSAFRLLWIGFSSAFDSWRSWAHLMQPRTVNRWHGFGFRVFWRWKSRVPTGRPPISAQMRNLIRRLSKENPLWSPERIHDTLLMLGYADVPCEKTILKYMHRPSRRGPKSTTWKTFIRNHMDVSWAMDFVNVPTFRFGILYVLVIINHGRRRVIHFKATENPTMQWVIQQLREATPFGFQPKYLFRDNDRIYGHGVPRFLESCDIDEVRTAYRSPWQNPFVERFFLTLRREMLDHVIVFGPRHVERLIRDFLNDYYHSHRPHQGLKRQPPVPIERPNFSEDASRLISLPVLNGLHHQYFRVAA